MSNRAYRIINNSFFRNSFIFITVTIAQLIFIKIFGFDLEGDPLRYYSVWADNLIKANFNYAYFFKNNIFMVPITFYFGFINLVAISKIILGANWYYGIFFLNIIATSSTAVILASLIYKLTKCNLSVWFAFFAFLLCYEIIYWSSTALADSIASFFAFLIFYLFILLEEKGGTHLYINIAIILTMFISSFFHPTGFLIVLSIFLFLFYGFIENKLPLLKRREFAFILTIFILLFFIIIPYAYIIKSICLSLGSNKANCALSFVAESFGKGEIIRSRPLACVLPPVTLLDYIVIILKRFISFFQFAAVGFSPIHNIFSSIYFIPLYLFYVLGLLYSLLFQKDKKRIIYKTVLLSFLFIFIKSLFHSLTIIDFDWRYRLPILPHIILIASLGVYFLRCTFSNKLQVKD